LLWLVNFLTQPRAPGLRQTPIVKPFRLLRVYSRMRFGRFRTRPRSRFGKAIGPTTVSMLSTSLRERTCSLWLPHLILRDGGSIPQQFSAGRNADHRLTLPARVRVGSLHELERILVAYASADQARGLLSSLSRIANAPHWFGECLLSTEQIREILASASPNYATEAWIAQVTAPTRPRHTPSYI
jgi:hypothetical protein